MKEKKPAKEPSGEDKEGEGAKEEGDAKPSTPGAAAIACKTCGAPGKPGDAVCLACGAELGPAGPALIEKIPKPAIFAGIGVIAVLLIGLIGWKIYKSVKLSGFLTAGHTNADAGKFPQAKQGFEQALKEDPDNLEALQGLIQVGVAQPDWALVKKRGPVLSAKSAPGHDRAAAKRDVARAYLETGEFANAVKWAKEARNEDSSIESTDEIEGLGHLGANEKEAAQDCLAKADSGGTQNAKVQLGLAKLAEPNWKQSRQWAEKATGKKDAPYWVEVARYRELDGDKKAALGALEQARDADPKNPTARVRLATAYLEQKQYKEALAEANAAKEAKPDDAEVAKVRGQALLENGEIAPAKQELERAEKLAGDDPSAAFLHGRVLIRAGEINPGLDKLEKAVKKRDKDVALWIEAGSIALEVKRADKAVPFLEGAVKLEPRLGEGDSPEVKKPFVDAKILLAQALGAIEGNREKQATRIQALYQEATALDPKREDIYVGLGDHYLQLGKNAEALAALKQGLGVAPTSQPLLKKAAAAAMASKDFDEAIGDYEKILQLNPNDADAKNGLESAHQLKVESGK